MFITGFFPLPLSNMHFFPVLTPLALRFFWPTVSPVFILSPFPIIQLLKILTRVWTEVKTLWIHVCSVLYTLISKKQPHGKHWVWPFGAELLNLLLCAVSSGSGGSVTIFTTLGVQRHGAGRRECCVWKLSPLLLYATLWHNSNRGIYAELYVSVVLRVLPFWTIWLHLPDLWLKGTCSKGLYLWRQTLSSWHPWLRRKAAHPFRWPLLKGQMSVSGWSSRLEPINSFFI